MNIFVKVPATSANLGPGFDALGLALDLWNETVFSPMDRFSAEVTGEGAGTLPLDAQNSILHAAQRLAEIAGRSLEPFHVRCINRIPIGSGLGSSAAATLTGLLGANARLDSPLSKGALLDLATEIEGHSDNVAPALLGGLVVSTLNGGRIIARQIPIAAAALHVTIAVPKFHLPTREARTALPKQVPMQDAVHNLSRAVLVTEAFRAGDLDLLAQSMDDRLHQPYRLKLIPGAQAAMDAAKQAGAAAVALSGAGPSLIAFASKAETAVGEAMKRAFESVGLSVRVLGLGISREGARVESGR